jgi:hypothetical protein
MQFMSEKDIQTAYNDIVKDVTRYLIKWFVGTALSLAALGVGFYFRTIHIQESQAVELQRATKRVDKIEDRLMEVATKSDMQEVKALINRLDDKLEKIRD